MNMIKVRVKREQLEHLLSYAKTIHCMGEKRLYSVPEEITLELPAEQVEAVKGIDPFICAHDFEEIELGSLGKIKCCRNCGLCDGKDRDQKFPGDDPRSPVEKKRMRFRVLKVDRVGPRYDDISHGTVIELEEVE